MTKKNLVTKKGKKAIWTYVEGENLQYVGMNGEEEVTVQKFDKIMQTLRWPGGVVADVGKFENVIANHLNGDSFLQPIYQRK